MSEVISALSYALDLTGGRPSGHASRSCLLGMRIGSYLNLSETQLSALFYALLLKDLGCSTNASKMCYLFGNDERSVKSEMLSVDWCSKFSCVKAIGKLVMPKASIKTRLGGMFKAVLTAPRASKEIIEMRCERGAHIARELQLPELTAEAIKSLDEHWDGNGHPEGLKRHDIPLLSRIICLAQTVEVFASRYDLATAYQMADRRSGRWFDPMLVKVLKGIRRDDHFWKSFNSPDPKIEVAAAEPSDMVVQADDALMDKIAHGFAMVIDAKSPWTFAHSEGVCTIAAGIAETMGLDDRRIQGIRRAGLLHDIGKLGVSNLILDKPGKLDSMELAEMRKHTAYTHHILRSVEGFRDLAMMAASHHERMDGKGYHLGVPAMTLDLESRILAVADMYEALTAKRPYRQDLTDEEAMTIMTKNVGVGLDPEAFSALQSYRAGGGYVPEPIAA